MAAARVIAGEASDQETAPAVKRKKRNLFRRFLMANQAVYDEVGYGRIHLTINENRVWCILIARADVYNYVRERQTWMAKEYGIPKSVFSKALASLEAKDMVTRLLDRGQGNHLMISPFHFWKGNADDHDRYMSVYNRFSEICRERRRKGLPMRGAIA